MVLQTFSPENDVLRYAVAYDYEGFYRNEISLRAATMFPPFSKIVRVLVTGEDNKKTVEALRNVYFSLERLYTETRKNFCFSTKCTLPLNAFRINSAIRC